MTRLCENVKVKRFVTWLILLSLVMSSFITSTTETAYADSNSRRITSINLASGAGFGDITDANSIDEISMQTIAIYLSNFYIPFVTILDGDYTQEGAKDSGNNQHVKAMKDALIRNCGFDKEVTEYIISFVLEQSLGSCKSLYMKKSDLRSCFEKTKYGSGDKSYLGFSNGDGFTKDNLALDLATWQSSSITYTKQVISSSWLSGTTYGDWDYFNSVSSVTARGPDASSEDGGMVEDEYVPVSYAIFLGVMQNQCLEYYYNDAYNYGYRTTTIGQYSFYNLVTTDNGYEMRPVFSNDATCSKALLHALQYCDVENGYSTSFSTVSGVDVEAISNPEVTQYALVTCPNMYVNWEGSLIYDNGVYRTVVLPGCMNPYMVQKMVGSSSTPSLNFINNTSVSSIAMGLFSGSSKISIGGVAFKNYRVSLGSDQENFDQSWKPGDWGDNQTIHDLLKSIQYVNVAGTSGGDYARFPILTSRYTSSAISDVSGQPRFKTITCSSHTKNTDIVWCDLGNQQVKPGDTLNSFFQTSDITSLMTELRKYDVDTYAQFKNVNSQGHSLTYPKSAQKVFQNIYLTYCFAAFNAESEGSFDSNTHIVPMKFNFVNFPKANGDIEWKTVINDNNQLGEAVMSFVYYLLHPTQGVAYVTTLFKNKVSGILLGWHEDIVGGTSSNSATGMTKYLGTSSYTTMPNLKDISWVAGLLNIYNNIIVYLIILMCLILLCYVLTGSMTLQRGIVGVVLFGICAFLPPVAINAAVDVVNTTSDTVFSKKFDYWAICQLQNFVDEYQKAMEANADGNFTSYAAFVISNSKTDNSLQESDSTASGPSFSGAKVKWMAPKKYNSLASLVAAVNENTAMGNSSANFLKNSLLTMVAKSSSGETYLDDSESLYLYRDYADIFKYAHASYNIWGTFNYNGTLTGSGDPLYVKPEAPLGVFINTSAGGSSYDKAWNGIVGANDLFNSFIKPAISTKFDNTVASETSSAYHISKGYLYNTIGFNYSQNITSNTKFSYLYANTGTPRNTLSVSYLANYTKTFREVQSGLSRLIDIAEGDSGAYIQAGTPSSGRYYNFGLPKASSKSTDINGSYMWGYSEILGLQEQGLPTNLDTSEIDKPGVYRIYKNLSDVFYGLYAESPFFFFNANIRDQANSTELNSGDNYEYDFDDLSRGKLGTVEGDSESTGSFGQMNHISRMFLQNNQEYFFNLTPNAGDGYGELRDFTNMHDFFYFVIPYMRSGVELARLYDDVFGLYVDEDCSLIVNADGSILYDGQRFETIEELNTMLQANVGKYTEEELYKLWHSYNTYTILSAYTPWLDTMLDCDYSKAETISVMGEKFRVSDPLDPRTYYREEGGVLVEGRYMVFSKSEMNAMGLTTADLTTVERKIIQFQENVYNNTLNLMNYYTFADEVMIQAYAMLQTFEFNKLFSQTSLVSTSYVMYPQGYELKAFSYDAYLRMIVSGASGESLMFNGTDAGGNVSIYERVMKNTSLFFGIFLLLNDLLAVYVIPGLKIFFLVTIFICSVLILVGSVIKMEMNIFSVLWKSLFAPLLSFSAVCIGLSVIVSMFMKTGANGVVSSEFSINVGDPTSVIILMIILNVLVVILMWKICKKCFRDLITYGKAVFDNIGGTVVGAVGAIGAGFAGGTAMSKFGSKSHGGSGVSRTAKQRGKDNDPRSGRAGVGSALAAGAGGAAFGAAAAMGAGAGGGSGTGTDSSLLSAKERQHLQDRQKRDEDMAGMNKYDRKAYTGAANKLDTARDKVARDAELAANAKGIRKARFELAQKLHQRQANSAAIKVDNVKKYGTGLKGKFEGATTIVGGKRKGRLEALGGVNGVMGSYYADRISASKGKASDHAKAQTGKTPAPVGKPAKTTRTQGVGVSRAAPMQKKGSVKSKPRTRSVPAAVQHKNRRKNASKRK